MAFPNHSAHPEKLDLLAVLQQHGDLTSEGEVVNCNGSVGYIDNDRLSPQFGRMEFHIDQLGGKGVSPTLTPGSKVEYELSHILLQGSHRLQVRPFGLADFGHRVRLEPAPGPPAPDSRFSTSDHLFTHPARTPSPAIPAPAPGPSSTSASSAAMAAAASSNSGEEADFPSTPSTADTTPTSH
ncbi:hypothetical protein JCM8097_005280 [Rhodosporidiobolus ruineniae]